jgi:heme A synthase
VSNLVNEVLLRLAKAGTAALLGLVVYLVAIGIAGAAPSVELALLCWLSGAAFVLLVESSLF